MQRAGLAIAIIVPIIAVGIGATVLVIAVGDWLGADAANLKPVVSETDAINVAAEYFCPGAPELIRDKLRAGDDSGIRIVWITDVYRSRFAVNRLESDELRVMPLNPESVEFANRIPASCVAQPGSSGS